MRIRICEGGEIRSVRIEAMMRTTENTVLIGGFMDFGRAERVGIEIDADTLGGLVQAALVGGFAPEPVIKADGD